jgi:hypothetical protein
MNAIYFSLFKPEEIHTFAMRLLPLVEPLLKGDSFLASLCKKVQQGIMVLSILWAWGVAANSRKKTD